MATVRTCDQCGKAESPTDPIYRVIVRDGTTGANLTEADLCGADLAHAPVPAAPEPPAPPTPDQAGGA